MKVDHLTAIVHDADAVANALSRLLGKGLDGALELPGMSIRTFRLGDVEIHVNAPTGPGPVHEFFHRHGPGLHHLALRVSDLDAELAELVHLGFPALGLPIETAPGVREVFLDPAHTGGLMIQLVERHAEVTAGELDRESVARLVGQGAGR